MLETPQHARPVTVSVRIDLAPATSGLCCSPSGPNGALYASGSR